MTELPELRKPTRALPRRLAEHGSLSRDDRDHLVADLVLGHSLSESIRCAGSAAPADLRSQLPLVACRARTPGPGTLVTQDYHGCRLRRVLAA